jgi:ketosteroid isomerase-like protein
VANVIVMRVRDGKIVESRDYHDHAAIGEALGDHAELLSGPPARA